MKFIKTKVPKLLRKKKLCDFYNKKTITQPLLIIITGFFLVDIEKYPTSMTKYI